MTQLPSPPFIKPAIALLKIHLQDVSKQPVYNEGEVVWNEHRGGPDASFGG